LQGPPVRDLQGVIMGGFFAVWNGMAYLAGHRNLWGLALMPFLLNVLLFVGFFAAAMYGFDSWMEELVPAGEAWYWAALSYLAWTLAVVLMLAFQVILFAVVGRILASPFLDILTKRVEQQVLGQRIDFNEMPIWRSVWRTLVQEAGRLALYLGIILILLLLNLLPVLGSMAYSVLTVLVSCFFLACEFMDYPMERRGLKLGGKLAMVWRLKIGWLGFGGSLFLVAMIPLVNLLFLPAAAVGGTLLFLENRARLSR
jgi:CysZ protein